ncbi:MAG TPA: shikimate dehydrogenase [Bacillota bacterium]|nr:shikimate dehydrogenase [Peptococcaceae bacterium MAG4]NLW37792.1 shikimate dehydrogenase [Peptococcaceae bacterium]HPZ44289.1 shikimate dehydrogenase [Bacillota bacterium]HQD76885.1 shikimate dehydrogenase [Bacillota bacterium]HUM59540.1 shikimate dehydrogenase [Bacillota bacterium]
MASGISSRTKVCGILGYPLEHTLSPAMHNAAFEAKGLDFVYLPFPIEADRLQQAVAAVKSLGLVGVNVTIPHKEAVLPLLDELSEEARLIGAVNTIVNQSGRLYGDNTDGRGFLCSLRKTAGFLPSGKTVLLLGAGGAARAVAVALALAGARKIILANRSKLRAEELAAHLSSRIGTNTEVLTWPEPEGLLPGEALQAADFVVQATSLGMYPGCAQTVPLPFNLFRPGQVACDLVYNPVQTEFLRQAREAGATTVDGLGMLLYQGALAFELWTGQAAPLEAMKKALIEAVQK